MKLTARNLIVLALLVVASAVTTLREGKLGGNDGNTANRSAQAPAAHSGAKWSDTSPAINLHHIFDGEINRRGKPTGFHARPGGRDPANARVVSVKSRPNRAGVYTASVEVRDGGQWKEKFSTFFPDSFNRQQVLEAIMHAWRNSDNQRAQPWRGPSGHGFQIEGYTLSRGDINTAYPIYRRD